MKQKKTQKTKKLRQAKWRVSFVSLPTGEQNKFDSGDFYLKELCPPIMDDSDGLIAELQICCDCSFPEEDSTQEEETCEKNPQSDVEKEDDDFRDRSNDPDCWGERVLGNPLEIFKVPDSEMNENLWNLAVVRDPRLVVFLPPEYSNSHFECMKVSVGEDLIRSSTAPSREQKHQLAELFFNFRSSTLRFRNPFKDQEKKKKLSTEKPPAETPAETSSSP